MKETVEKEKEISSALALEKKELAKKLESMAKEVERFNLDN